MGEVQPGGDPAFKTFTNMAYGYRAMFVTLGTYLRQGKNTIEKIVRSWAPPSENNTESYIRHLEQLSGIARNKTLTSADGEDYIKIVVAMSRIENGIPAVMDDVVAGFKLQSKIIQ